MDSLFTTGQTYKIEGKPFEYLGKVREMMFHEFVCIDNPEDVRQVSIFLGDYLMTIYKGTA